MAPGFDDIASITFIHFPPTVVLMQVLPVDHLEKITGWGGAVSSVGYVYRPTSVEGIKEVFALAMLNQRAVTVRGSGNSYGDGATGSENLILDLTRMNRILGWDPESGIITLEPGVTIEQLWQYTIEDGWWPPVVSGTMYPTIGGALGMNIHGKNNFKVGTIGEHVLEYEILFPNGELKTVTRDSEPEIFYAAISSFGILGCFTRVKMQMKKVYSGRLQVKGYVAKNLHEQFEIFDKHLSESDYLVGWTDCFASGEAIGRSIIHQANYIPKGEDHFPFQTLQVKNQMLPDLILGFIPKSMLWRFMRPFSNDVGVRFINAARFLMSKLPMLGNAVYDQSHAEFAFLLDYVPGWKRSYGREGLIQYQSFIPKEQAESVFQKQIEMSQTAGLVPYLAVFKRHRPDRFLITHSVDGYSLALDYKVTAKNRERLWELCHKMNDVVLAAGGRFYFAKDATLRPQDFRAFLGEEALETLRVLKNRFDPQNLLQTDLSRRLMPKQK